jgi:hypothetical protein
MTGRSKFAALVAIALIACTASLALAAGTSPSNGDFEKGSLKGWKTFTSPDSSGSKWQVYKKGDLPGEGSDPVLPRGDSAGPGSLYPPPQGKFAAYGFGNGGGPRILYRTLHLKPEKKITLSMKVFYKNFAKRFITPQTFNEDGNNQQYRIDLIRKDAELDSLADKDILKSVFRTRVGDKLRRKPFTVSKNLSSLAGKDVVLRFAETDTEFFFYPGVDAVKLKQKSKKG